MAAVLALLASVLWGGSDFLGGLTSRRLSTFAVYGGSQVFGALFLGSIALITGAWRTDLAYGPWALVAAVTGGAGMLLFYRALSIGPMGIVAPLVGLSVIVPVAFGLLRGEQPTSLQVLGIVLAVCGILLASGPELGDTRRAEPLVLSVIAILCFGVVYIAVAEGSRTSALMTTTAMRVTTTIVAVIAWLAIRSSGGVRRRDLPTLATVGITDAGANLSFGLASTVGLLATTSVLASLYPVVTALLAAVVTRE